MFVVVMFVLAMAISLPFLVARDDEARKRIYIPLCFAPIVLSVLMFWRYPNPFSMYLLGMVFVLPLSFMLTLIGITLGVRAWSRDEEWGALAKGALLASSPVILFFCLVVILVLAS